MEIDWAMQEAMEEVDALTPACRPIAPPRRTERGRFYEVDALGTINGVPLEHLRNAAFLRDRSIAAPYEYSVAAANAGAERREWLANQGNRNGS